MQRLTFPFPFVHHQSHVYQQPRPNETTINRGNEDWNSFKLKIGNRRRAFLCLFLVRKPTDEMADNYMIETLAVLHDDFFFPSNCFLFCQPLV